MSPIVPLSSEVIAGHLRVGERQSLATQRHWNSLRTLYSADAKLLSIVVLRAVELEFVWRERDKARTAPRCYAQVETFGKH
jgi:hypothetical protein